MKRMSERSPDPDRAQEIAADVRKITDAIDAARELLDFNDEPARFHTVLDASPPLPSVRAAARHEPKASAAASRRK